MFLLSPFLPAVPSLATVLVCTSFLSLLNILKNVFWSFRRFRIFQIHILECLLMGFWIFKGFWSIGVLKLQNLASESFVTSKKIWTSSEFSPEFFLKILQVQKTSRLFLYLRNGNLTPLIFRRNMEKKATFFGFPSWIFVLKKGENKRFFQLKMKKNSRFFKNYEKKIFFWKIWKMYKSLQ